MSITAVIVDDEDDIRTLIRTVIESSNPEFSVTGEAADGTEGVEQVDRCEPDVVIIDQRMPGMTGIETAQEILRRHPMQKLILCSAYLDADLKRQAQEVGIHVCLAKGEIRRIPEVMRQLAEAS